MLRHPAPRASGCASSAFAVQADNRPGISTQRARCPGRVHRPSSMLRSSGDCSPRCRLPHALSKYRNHRRWQPLAHHGPQPGVLLPCREPLAVVAVSCVYHQDDLLPVPNQLNQAPKPQARARRLLAKYRVENQRISDQHRKTPGTRDPIQLRNPRPTMLIRDVRSHRRHHALNPARQPLVVSPQVHDLSLSHRCPLSQSRIAQRFRASRPPGRRAATRPPRLSLHAVSTCTCTIFLPAPAPRPSGSLGPTNSPR